MPDYDEAAIRSQYPQLAYLLNDPEIGAVLRKAYEGGYAPDKFQAEIMATDWWKRTSDTQRAYYLEQNSDPSTFLRKLEGQATLTRRIAGELGYDLDSGYIQHFSEMAMRDGLDEAALRAHMVDEITPLIGTTERSPVLAEIRKASQDWGIVLDTKNLNYWLAELGSGRRTVDNLNQAMRQQISDMFPNLGNEFAQGQTFRQIQQPYQEMASKLLEIDPERVDFIGDPKFRQMLQQVDDKGVTRKMSLTEAANHLRRQDEWKGTKNFMDRSDAVVRSLQGVFTGG